MDVMVPRTLNELLPNIDNEKRRICAGCTDVMVALKVGKLKEKPMTSICRLNEIKRIFEKDGFTYVGSNVTMTEIMNHGDMKEKFPLLNEALDAVGSPQIRNRATLGGNICNASPAGDAVLALVLYDAELVLSSLDGDRIVKVKDFVKGPGRTELRRNEFLKYVRLRNEYEGFSCYFEKIGERNAVTISVASMGLLYNIQDGIVKHIRIAYGAVGPTVVRATAAEDFLVGREVNGKNLLEAAEIIGKCVSPIDDARGSAKYRTQTCRNMIMRLAEL